MVSKLVRLCAWTIWLIWFGTAGSAFAQQMSFKVLTDRAGCSSCIWLQATGEITPQTVGVLNSFLRENPYISVVQVDSAGGNLAAALELGEIVRSRNISMVVGGAKVSANSSGDIIATRVAGQCLSACAYFLAGGASRSQVVDSLIGVHQFYGGTELETADSALETGQRMSGLLINYLTRMDVSPSLVTVAASTRPDEIYLLNNTEKLRFGLLTSIQEQYSSAPGYRRAVSTSGMDAFGDNDRVPPASIEECGKARYTLADSESLAEMQIKNRFFRDVCNRYFETIRLFKVTECQAAWNVAYNALHERTPRSFAYDGQLASVSLSMLHASCR